LFFLLTSGRRHSASVSEILNVAPIRSISLDGRPLSIQNPRPGDQNPGIGNPGLEKPRGLPAPGIASKPPTSPRTQCPRGIPVAWPHSIPEPMHRRVAYRHCRASSDTISVDVELSAHRQCDNSATHPQTVERSFNTDSHNLHSRRDVG
jgi:hypothetical protein